MGWCTEKYIGVLKNKETNNQPNMVHLNKANGTGLMMRLNVKS